MRQKTVFLTLLLALLLSLTGCQGLLDALDAPPEPRASSSTIEPAELPQAPLPDSPEQSAPQALRADALPAYEGEPWVVVNDNLPAFENLTTTKAFETYSGLDKLGRCGTAFANVCPELMPEAERGPIGAVKPSGWQSVKYDFIDGNFLYNRCHLIGYQLTGENTNVCNLITGTRSLNVEGMLPFENRVADYVRRTGNHVLYRATPVFVGEELVARGVELEGWSVEDEGQGICFHVWCFNVQPGIDIDYATGESTRSAQAEEVQPSYILNVTHKKFHLPDCPSVEQMAPKNRKRSRRTREELVAEGWVPCGRCKP